MLDTKESLKEKIIKRGFWIYLFTFLGGPLGYFIKMMISGDLSVEEVGILYGIIGLIGLLSTYNDLGFAEALGFFLPKFAVAKEYSKFKTTLAYAMGAQIISSIVLSVGLYYFADNIAIHYFGHPDAAYVLRVFCLFFIGSNFFHLINNTLLALQEAKVQTFFGFLRTLFSAIFVGILFLSSKGNLESYAWTWIVSIMLNMVAIYIYFYFTKYRTYLKGIPFHWDKKLFKTIFSYALMILLTANIGTVLSQVDMQMIIMLLGAKDAGYYTNYLSLIGIPFMVFSPLVGFLFPIISSLEGEEWMHKIRLIKSYFRDFSFAVAPALALYFAICGPELARFFFTEKFVESGYILAWSAPFLVFNFLIQINFQILGGLGRIKERMKILSVGLGCNIILNLVFIKLFGVYGSALAVGVSWIPIWFLSNRATKEFDTPFSWYFFSKNIIVASVVGVLVYFLQEADFLTQQLQSRVFLLFWLPLVAFFYIIAFALSNRNLVKNARQELLEVIRNRKKTS